MQTTSKSMVLAGMLTLTGWAFWFALRAYFLSGISVSAIGLSYTPILLLVIPLLLVFLTLYGISIALIPSPSIWNLSWILVSIGGFFVAPTLLTGIVALLFAIVGPIMRYRGRQSLRYGIGKNLYIPLRNAFPTMLTVLALFIALLFPALEPQVPGTLEIVIPEQLFLGALRLTDNKISEQLPAFDADAPFEEYALGFAASELNVDLDSLTKGQQIQIIEEAKNNLKEKLNIEIDTKRTLGEILYTGGISRLNEATAPYIRFFPYVTAIGLFLLLRFAFFFVRIIVVLFSAAIIKLLIKFGFARTIAMQHTVSYPTL